MLLGAMNSKPLRKRARKPKVKTGCQTCRTRRLKCDETRPSCVRCIKSGFECDFILNVPKRDVLSRPKPKPLAPKYISKQATSHQPIFYPPSTIMFIDERERRYFQFFCQHTSYELSGCYDSALWRLILQACETDSAICHTIIAIGALDLTSKRFKTQRSFFPNTTGEVERDHRFALQQYGKAIQLMKEFTAKKKVNLRNTLIGCILLTCFETFHGNHQSAIAQIQSGLNLLEDWHSQITPTSAHLLGTSSPSPYVLEDELVQALGRLDVHSLSFLDPRPKTTHERMRHYGQASIDIMPTSFSNLKEAKIYQELILRRLLHFLVTISKAEGADGVIQMSTAAPALPEAVFVEQRKYREELQYWHKAFQPLLKAARTPEGEKNFLAASGLEVSYLTAFYGLDAMTQDAERFTLIFKEIVSLCKIILEHPDTRSSESTYIFDLYTAVPLYTASLRCRHSGIRRQAIALLLSSPRREGVWDAMLVGKIAGWVADLEEEGGLDGGFMRKGRGAVDLNFDFDLQTRSVHVQCLQMNSESETLVKKKATLTW